MSESGRKVEHRCSPFVRIKNEVLRPLTQVLIHEVEFKLCGCNNPRCENTIRKRPKCNNCEACLKRNGGWIEPDYEMSAVLNCWEKFSVPIKIYFRQELNSAP